MTSNHMHQGFSPLQLSLPFVSKPCFPQPPQQISSLCEAFRLTVIEAMNCRLPYQSLSTISWVSISIHSTARRQVTRLQVSFRNARRTPPTGTKCPLLDSNESMSAKVTYVTLLSSKKYIYKYNPHPRNPNKLVTCLKHSWTHHVFSMLN